jgi:hypothetical protein
MQVGKSSLAILGVAFLLLRLPMAAHLWAGEAQLSWQTPTTNEDGTPATDLASVRIHYGTQSRGTTIDPTVFQYQQTITIAASQTTRTVTGLTDGVRYYFSVTALDSSGNQSKYSNEVSKIITGGTPSTLLSANFNTGANGFVYIDDTFSNTSRPAYASGAVSAGSLRVTLGGIDDTDITNGMSGGWRRSFTVGGSAVASVTLSFRYNLTQAATYETDEYSDVRATVGTVQLGASGQTYVARITGDGNGGTARSTGWQTFTATRQLAPGTYALTLGGYNNKKTLRDETTTILIDDVLVTQNATSQQVAQSSLSAASSQEFLQPLATAVQPVQTRPLPADAQRHSLSTAPRTPETRGRALAAPPASRMHTVAPVEAPREMWLEAEMGRLTTPMEVGTDSAEIDQYIWVPEGTENALESSPTAGAAQYTLTINAPGFYVIWGRLQPGAQGTGSFFLTLNNEPALVWEFSDSAPGDGDATEPVDRADRMPGAWQWQQAFQNATPVIFLEVGVHTLTLQHRQAGIKLDRLLLTSDLDFVPQD